MVVVVGCCCHCCSSWCCDSSGGGNSLHIHLSNEIMITKLHLLVVYISIWFSFLICKDIHDCKVRSD